MSTFNDRLTLRVRWLLRERPSGVGLTARIRGKHSVSRQPPEPYITIEIGGPLDGLVILTASDSPRVLVEAIWHGRHGRERISLARPSEREALLLADHWANELIDGREPSRHLPRLPYQEWSGVGEPQGDTVR